MCSHYCRAVSVWLSCRGCVDIVRWPWRHHAFFWACGVRAVPVLGLCDAIYNMSMGYGLTIFKISITSPLNKFVEAAEPVNPYENLTAASCLRTERGIRSGYGLRRPIAGQMWTRLKWQIFVCEEALEGLKSLCRWHQPNHLMPWRRGNLTHYQLAVSAEPKVGGRVRSWAGKVLGRDVSAAGTELGEESQRETPSLPMEDY